MLHKDVFVEEYRVHHRWRDKELKFEAIVFKSEYRWVLSIGDVSMTLDRYTEAVDAVMDQWRLVRAGLGSWEERAAVYAQSWTGKPWDELSDDEQQDLINSVRDEARMSEGL